MLVYWLLHVENLPGEAQLLAGDIGALKTLLPQSAVVARIEQRPGNGLIHLSQDEAQTLLAELKALDVDALDQKYHRSAVHPNLSEMPKSLWRNSSNSSTQSSEASPAGKGRVELGPAIGSTRLP